MTDDQHEKDNVTDEPSFAELFESYTTDSAELHVGDQIKGKVISIGSDDVFINTGTKTDGVVAKKELLDDKGNLNFKVGDPIELYVTSVDESEIRLSKSISGKGADLYLLKDAHIKQIPVEGKVTEQCKGGFRVDIMKKTAFCPISQIDIKYADTPEAYVGSTFDFLVTKFEEKGKNLVVSRRELLKKQFAVVREKFLHRVKIGDVFEGKITKIMPFGVFVELEAGIEGMVHISELSWSRSEHPDEIVKRNEILKVKILDIQIDEKKPENTKISLSAKQAMENPWESVSSRFRVGEKISGKVSRITDFGAFVEISPGVDGLVHISEMSYTRRILRPEDVVSAGETVSVMIKDIDLGKKRISLSIKDAEGDPWINIENKYSPGQTLKGTIEKKESFGFFISLEPGITGLLPKSKIENSESASQIDKLKISDAIPVVIETVNSKDRKISLTIGDAIDKNEWKNYMPDQRESSSPSLGDLGAKLAEALKSKK